MYLLSGIADNSELLTLVEIDALTAPVEDRENRQLLNEDANSVIEDDEQDQAMGIYDINLDVVDELDIREDSQTVFEWLRKLKKGSIITDPDFQRNHVWTSTQKSRFVESVLLNIPLPPVYVNQNVEGKYIIVDGLQRTTALSEFITYDEYGLSNLTVLKDLDKMRFKELPEKMQSAIEDKKMLVFVIKPSVPLTMVYEIFSRINTGGTQLNRQEVRNCVFIGEATRLLNKLSKTEQFKSATGWGISPKRMKDREVILRCLAFRIQDYTSYKGDMDAFLSQALNMMNSMHPSEIERLTQEFLDVMNGTLQVFGSTNFRVPTSYTRGQINVALMEVIYRVFVNHPEILEVENIEGVRLRFDNLINNSDFLDAISRGTGSRGRVLTRFTLAHSIVGSDPC